MRYSLKLLKNSSPVSYFTKKGMLATELCPFSFFIKANIFFGRTIMMESHNVNAQQIRAKKLGLFHRSTIIYTK